MPFYLWTRFKQLLKQPWTSYVVVFAYNYLCNDISAAVQKQGFGVITFVPYMAVLSILAVDFVFSWIKDVRLPETLPRHVQDTEMIETRQAEVMQMGQTHTPSLLQQRDFKRRPWMVNEEVEDAAAGIKQQTGEQSESQRLSSHAKDEVAEVKPQQSVCITKDKCTESQVWKSRELPKQDLTSSLAKGTRKGGSTNIDAGVATTSNKRYVHMESTRHNDAANDVMMESKDPQQHRSNSKNKQSTGRRDRSINSDAGVVTTEYLKSANSEPASQRNQARDEVMDLKNSQQQKSPSKNKQSTGSGGGSINSGAEVATTGNQKAAQTESTCQSNEAKSEMESKNPHRHRPSSKNKQRTVSRGGSINTGAGVASTENWRGVHTGFTSSSQKDDAKGGLQSKNLQKRKSLSKNKCVLQAHELPEPHEPSLIFPIARTLALE